MALYRDNSGSRNLDTGVVMGEKIEKRDFHEELKAFIKNYPVESLDNFELSLLVSLTEALHTHSRILSTFIASMEGKKR